MHQTFSPQFSPITHFMNTTTITMSDYRSAMLDKLAEYGRSGSNSLLADISNCLPEVTGCGKSCPVPLETSVSVLNQCIRVLKKSKDSKRKQCVWHILIFMCSRAYNSLSSDLLTLVDASEIIGLIAPSVHCLSVENDLEGVLRLEFVTSFAMSSGHRQTMVGQAEGLIDAVLRAVEKLFIPARDVVKITLLRSLSTVVSGGGRSCHEKFIQNGAFPIVNTVFGIMYPVGLSHKGGAALRGVELILLQSCLSALYAMFNSCLQIAATNTDLPRTMYSYDPTGFVMTNSALFEFLTVSEDHQFVESSIVLIGKYLSFVEKVHPESLEFVLLYRGKKLSPTTYSGKPMIVHAILITRHTQYQHMAQTATDYMLEYMEMFPSVDTMVRDYLSKEILVFPPSGPAPKVCALPDCYVCSFGRLMRKCGRCRAVYYCAEDHQKEHWAEHKLVCVPKKETLSVHTT